jgi:hypothetical protein
MNEIWKCNWWNDTDILSKYILINIAEFSDLNWSLDMTNNFHVVFTVHLDTNVTLCSPCILTSMSRCVHRASWHQCHVLFTVHLDINVTLCSPCILTSMSRCVHRASWHQCHVVFTVHLDTNVTLCSPCILTSIFSFLSINALFIFVFLFSSSYICFGRNSAIITVHW